MSPLAWKGWSRFSRTDGQASPHRERSGGADASTDAGSIQAPGYVSPVAWQGWSRGQETLLPAAVESAAWAGWSKGQEILAAPAEPALVDKSLGNPPGPAPIAAAIVPRVAAPAGAASLNEAEPVVGQEGALGKRVAASGSAPLSQQASRQLEEAVARAREQRKFTRGGFTAALKVAKAKGEKVGSLEVDSEGLAEAVDKFALSLTNKDYQMALGMSTEAFYGMNAEYRLRAMHYK